MNPLYDQIFNQQYALGLGKEVIITCNSSLKNLKLPPKEKKYEKYLRPHFDIAQRQILFWDDYKDLTKKLSEWIKALF